MNDVSPSRVARPQPARRERRGGVWLLRFGVLAVALIVALGLTEAALWIVAPIKFHEWMIWIPDGHIKGRAEPGQVFKTGDGYDVRINKLGFRGPDYTWHPAPGTLRIACFGGSSTFCYHERGEEETWPGRLQTNLSKVLGMPVEVINLGLPGYDTSNSKVNYVFVGRELHPHVALVYHTWNDMKFFRRLADGPIVFFDVASNKPLWQKIARQTQIARRVRNFLLAMEYMKTENYYTSLEESDAEANQPVSPAALAWARRNFDDIARFVRGDGRLPVLITQATICVPENFDDTEYRRQMGSEMVGMTVPIIHRTWLEMNRIIRDVAEERNAVFVDGYNVVPHDFEHMQDEVHLTSRGCAVLAAEIVRVLMQDPRFLEVVERVRGEGLSAATQPSATRPTVPAGD